MRFALTFLAAVAYAALAAQAGSSADGGSLEALLDQIAAQHNASEEVSSVKAAVDSSAPSVKVPSRSAAGPATPTRLARRSRKHAAAQEAKRWIWATEIIQDGTPNAPPIGANVNELGSVTVTVNTPSVSLPSPSIMPADQLSAFLNASVELGNATASLNASTSASSTAFSAPTTAPVGKLPKKFGQPQAGHRRWIWADSVIQDGATGVPQIGPNANLLTDGPPGTTPQLSLASPTFPPSPEGPATTEVPVEVPTSVAVQVPSSAAATTTSPAVEAATNTVAEAVAAPASTSPAIVWADLVDLFSQIERILEGSVPPTYAATSAPPDTTVAPDKRWIWANSVIQDGATGVPPPGQNANLLTSSPVAPAETPTLSLESPSFPPMETPATTPAVKAAAGSPGSDGQTSPSATTSTAYQRMTWAQMHAIQVAEQARQASASAAAAKAATTHGPQRWTAAQQIAALREQQAQAAASSSSSLPAGPIPEKAAERLTWAQQARMRAQQAQQAQQVAPANSDESGQFFAEHQRIMIASASSASAAARATSQGEMYRHKRRMVRARRH
ncbi:hypothetical protein JCM8202_005061 [Rhodotorula sphaerocarpa]